MARSIVVPYDGSPAARVVLRRAAAVAAASRLYCGLVIATTGLEPDAIDDAVAEAARSAGPGLPVQSVWLRHADPLAALDELLARLPDATLAVPLGARGRAPWYTAACRSCDDAARTMLFFVKPRDLQAADVTGREVRGPVSMTRRLLARFRAPRRDTAAGAAAGDGAAPGADPLSGRNRPTSGAPDADVPAPEIDHRGRQPRGTASRSVSVHTRDRS